MREDVETLKDQLNKAIYNLKNSKYSPKKDINLQRYWKIKTLESILSLVESILKKDELRKEQVQEA